MPETEIPPAMRGIVIRSIMKKKGSEKMSSSRKGIPHRKWSKEDKLKYVKMHLDEHISIMEIDRVYGVNYRLVSACIVATGVAMYYAVKLYQLIVGSTLT